MHKHLFILLLAVLPAHAQSVYKCVSENGSTEYSDKPCGNTGKDQEVLPGYSASPERPAASAHEDSGETELHQLIIGSWKWSGGDEVRTFNVGGRFTSTGKDDFATTNGRGEWEITEDQLIIRAKFDNIFSDGSTVAVGNILRLTIRSMTENVMVVYWDRYDKTSEWKKL